jgi:glycosyltransferase involved in cell wall biosynthesis
MKISILSPNLSSNGLARPYNLACVLARKYEVEIVGVKFNNEIWRPGDTGRFQYKWVKGGSTVAFTTKIPKLMKKVTGDIVYAHAPLLTSFGVSLIKKAVSRRPVILDIDDWELGFHKYYTNNISMPRKIIGFGLSIRFPNSYGITSCIEKLIGLSDDITVSNRYLQQKFGGTLVYHGRDMNTFDIYKFDKQTLKKKLGLLGRKVIAFVGSPSPYKGVEDLVESIRLVQNHKVMLIIVCLTPDEYIEKLYANALKKLGSERVRLFKEVPFDRIPEFLSVADLIVIPQRKNFATVGQMPMKVFDAMAMAKPIIATDVSDMPEILEGCGWIVEPENPKQLAETIDYVLDHPAEAEEMGWKARQKCIEKYSWDAMEKILMDVFEKYE